MKPNDWDKLTPEQKKELAIELFKSIRGQYILSQALYYGMEKLREVEPAVMREQSNIEDMEILYESLFSIFVPLTNVRIPTD